jgi:hypothetical protein
MRHAQITDLKNTKKLAEEAREADVLVSWNGETVFYVVNPLHYEALVSAALEAGSRTTEAFLASYERRRGSLAGLDAAHAASVRGEWASADEEAGVFGS